MLLCSWAHSWPGSTPSRAAPGLAAHYLEQGSRAMAPDGGTGQSRQAGDEMGEAGG
jgi:hypothetical protein